MKLIDLLKQRKNLAKKFTQKEFTDRVKDDLKYYNAMPPELPDVSNIDLLEAFNRRYNFTIPLVFTNHESMMASMFDRVPDLIFTQKGKFDHSKAVKVEATYEYLKDKLDLESFATDAAWWYILSGFVSSHADYVKKTIDQPMIDEETGEEVYDESGQLKTYTDYEYDDPVIEVDDPFKVYFSPESEFSYSAQKVPYYIKKKLLEPEEIKRVYKKDVKPDATMEGADDIKEEGAKTDLDRVKTWSYYGTLPKKVSGEVKGWEHDKLFYIVFTEKEILYKEDVDIKACRVAKWHGQPNKFFGFGIGKLLRPFQKEKSIRRGQQVRFADVAAFPKIILPDGGEIDIKTLRDPREQLVITYDKDQGKPEYMAAPNIGSAVNDANSMADQDAQQASGMLDISQGAQNTSTVKTATGQTIFADAAEKRIRLAKKKFFKFYRENVILLLKLCQMNWDSEKLISITDENGEDQTISVTAADLADVDFDNDVEIDVESVTINKDILREQAIALYDRVKDDPLIERKEVFKDMISKGFGIKNPERLLKQSPVPAGTQLVDPNSGQMFLVGESGELIDQATAEQMRNPTGEQGIPSSNSGIMGASQNVGI